MSIAFIRPKLLLHADASHSEAATAVAAAVWAALPRNSSV